MNILHANDVDPYSYGVVSLLFKIDPNGKPDAFDKIDFINDSQNNTYNFPFNLTDKLPPPALAPKDTFLTLPVLGFLTYT